MPGNTLFSIGEALIDMIPSRVGCTFDEVPSFSPRTGGAPANVCAAFARLGGASSFLTQLGDDPFGHKIARELEACGIDLSHLVFTDKANTALAFVSLEEDGNRTFSFYRKPSADLLYAPEQIDLAWFRDAFALHFCSVSLVDSPMRHAHLAAIGAAREAGAIVSFDPNLRFPLWPDREMLRQTVLQFLPLSNILKVSDEELEFLTGTADKLVDIGTNRHAGLAYKLDTVLGHGRYRRSVDDLGIHRHLDSLENITSGQVDSCSRLEIQRNVRLVGGNKGIDHLYDIALGKIVRLQLIGLQRQACLGAGNHCDYDGVRIYASPAHEHKLDERNMDS